MIKIIDVTFTPSQKDEKLRLIRYLTDNFGKAVAARQGQIDDKYRRWNQNYEAIPAQKVRSKPFQGASNFMPQLIRLHTDILTARVGGIILGTRPIWKPCSLLSETQSQQEIAVGQFMQLISLYRMKFPELVDTICFRGFKNGTVVTKDRWSEESKVKVISASDGRPNETLVWEKDFKVEVLPFEDFYPFPLTALTLDQTEIQFHRLRLTESQVQFRKSSKVWDEKACDALLRARDPLGASSQQQMTATNQGIALTPDIGCPFTAVEAHIDWELKSGLRYPLVVVFNPMSFGEDSLLRCYHRPGSDPFSKSFTDFRFFNSDQNFYCACIPAILEDSQEEQAQIHNSRRDANTIANVPGWKKKRYANTANPSSEWYPGKVFELDNMDDLVPLEFRGNYNSLVEEESFLLQLCERYTGVTPASQGQGSGVNGQTGYANTGVLAMISEGNRRQDTYIKRTRLPFNHIGKRAYTSYRDYGDKDELIKQYGFNAQLVEAIFEKETQDLQNGATFFELSCSDAGANRETDRSGLTVMANTMSAYYHEIVQAAQMVASVPDGSPVKELMLQVLDGARSIANRLLFVFDIGGREELLPDLRKVLGGGAPSGAGTPGLQPGRDTAALPEPQGPVSPENLRQLSQQLAAISGGAGQGRPQ